MDRRKLQNCLSHKSWLWQKIFAHFYLTPMGISPFDLKTEFEAQTAVRFCRNEDDLTALWELVEYLDFHEKEFVGAIEDIHYCRPIPWQYDFVQKVFELTQNQQLKFFDLDSVVDAFCLGLMTKNVDLSAIMQELDKSYDMLYATVAHKQNILRRNLSLTLETMYPQRFFEDTSELNCRELVDLFISRAGVEGIAKALKSARTADIKLTPEERACLAFSYYSPYFSDEVEAKQKDVPGCSVFDCTEDRLQDEEAQLEQIRAFVAEHYNNEDEEDDDNDEIAAVLKKTHNAVYVDPQERCVIDVVRHEPLYAHVYIEKFPQDDLNNSLPDFVRCHKGLLYTVEFVDDLKQLDVAQELNQRLNAIKSEALRLERACMDNPYLPLNGNFQRKVEQLRQNRRTCFYLSD